MICGNPQPAKNGETKPNSHFIYRSSSYLTRFFEDVGLDFQHDGSTRNQWVADVLEQLLSEPHSNAQTIPAAFAKVVETLMDIGDATDEDVQRSGALQKLNTALQREGFEAFYGEDKRCHLRHIGSGTITTAGANPHRPFTKDELTRRELLATYLDKTSEDQLIEEILLPLFRQLGFHRVTLAGHKDKALEYGKDIWMRFILPTQHFLYFGLQAKRGKLDSAGMSKAGSSNIAEILNQATMMLGHEIFDPETNKKVLVDHAFIVSGGEITKAAKNWLGGRLDQSKRSQIIFMDREDILNLFVVANVPLPTGALPTRAQSSIDDEIPF